MTPEQSQLWKGIQNFQLDSSESYFKFSDRLARENGWDQQYTVRVIEEYKKFIFLCCISQSGVTPSDAVDQAWHLHLTYTRSYWIDLCRDTLQTEIHHNPTIGGVKEGTKYDGYYTDTRQLYTEQFNIIPPIDIWPGNQQRFSDINFQRVNIKRYWLLKKPKFSVIHAILFMLVIVSCSFIQASYGYIIQIAAIGAIFIGLIWGNKNKKKGEDGDGGSGCSDGGYSDDGHHHTGHDSHSGDGGCSSGCSGCSSSGCSGCSSGGD